MFVSFWKNFQVWTVVQWWSKEWNSAVETGYSCDGLDNYPLCDVLTFLFLQESTLEEKGILTTGSFQQQQEGTVEHLHSFLFSNQLLSILRRET